MKLRSKINLFTTVLFICLLVIINSAIYFSFNRMMLTNDLQRVAAETAQKVKGMNNVDNTIATRDLLRAYIPVNGMLQIVLENGKQDAAITVPGQEYLLDHPIHYYKKEERKIINYDGMPHAFVSIPLIWNGNVAALQLTESLATTANNLHILKYVLIAVTIIAAIPVYVSTRLLSDVITRPILSIIKTMQEIRGSGQYKQISLPKQSKDELYQLGETFNEMIKQLKTNYEKQELFVANASHELKTPLTVIESYASLLKRRGRKNPEVFDESVAAIYSEAVSMKSLIQQLLLLAKIDEHWNVDPKLVSLADIIKESVRAFRAAYKREVNFIVKKNSTVYTDSDKLKQLFYILMDNARKYSEDVIKVKIDNINEQAVVEIIDRGIGISNEEQAKVFDRFFRVDKARSRKSGGFGLGLPLAKEIAVAIGAELHLESIEGLGTTVKIVFPMEVNM